MPLEKTHMTLWLLGAVIVFWGGLGALTFRSLRGAIILRATNAPTPRLGASKA